MTTVKKARGGPLPALKRFVHSKHMVTLVWILGIVVVWEIFACIVAATKRTPVNVLPHLYEIIGSFFSDKKVTGKMTMIELIGTACGETLSRAGIGFLAGIAAGCILALLMNLSRVVEKIAFPYLMIIQMIPILGMAPIILSITGDINSARIVIAAILTFYPVSTNVLAGFRSEGEARADVQLRCEQVPALHENAYPGVHSVFLHGAEDLGADGDNRFDTGGYAPGRQRTRLYALTVAQGRHDPSGFLGYRADKRGDRHTQLRADGADRKAALSLQAKQVR